MFAQTLTVEGRFPILREWDATVLAVLLLVMLLFSYRKQISYITKRIKAKTGENMSIVKSLSVGDGDMFYIRHDTDNFTVIDCCMPEDDKNRIVRELKLQAADKNVVRFISTHPDDDHILGLTCGSNHRSLLPILPATLGQLQTPASQIAVSSKMPCVPKLWMPKSTISTGCFTSER